MHEYQVDLQRPVISDSLKTLSAAAAFCFRSNARKLEIFYNLYIFFMYVTCGMTKGTPRKKITFIFNP